MIERQARHFPELLQAIRERIAELGITLSTVDEIVGLPSNYAAKLMCDPPMRRASPFTLFLIIEGLGLKMFLREDAETLSRVQTRLEQSKRSKPRAIRAVSTNKIVRIHLTPDFMKQIQRKGGYARAQRMTPAQRSKAARRAVRARWEKYREKLAGVDAAKA
jgi:hypothetical protein